MKKDGHFTYIRYISPIEMDQFGTLRKTEKHQYICKICKTGCEDSVMAVLLFLEINNLLEWNMNFLKQ